MYIMHVRTLDLLLLLTFSWQPLHFRSYTNYFSSETYCSSSMAEWVCCITSIQKIDFLVACQHDVINPCIGITTIVIIITVT
jgi:hypothetical protein